MITKIEKEKTKIKKEKAKKNEEKAKEKIGSLFFAIELVLAGIFLLVLIRKK
jgi:flagellar biogenesis protein FliO